jgi:hypothetical protein
MVSPFFCHRVLGDLGLQAFFGGHLLESMALLPRVETIGRCLTRKPGKFCMLINIETIDQLCSLLKYTVGELFEHIAE